MRHGPRPGPGVAATDGPVAQADNAVVASADPISERRVSIYRPIAFSTSAENFASLNPSPRSSPRRTITTFFEGMISAY